MRLLWYGPSSAFLTNISLLIKDLYVLFLFVGAIYLLEELHILSRNDFKGPLNAIIIFNLKSTHGKKS